MAKGSKGLSKIARDRRVASVSDERGSGDGIFVYLKPEFRCVRTATRTVHEDTVAEAAKALSEVRPRRNTDD